MVLITSPKHIIRILYYNHLYSPYWIFSQSETDSRAPWAASSPSSWKHRKKYDVDGRNGRKFKKIKSYCKPNITSNIIPNDALFQFQFHSIQWMKRHTVYQRACHTENNHYCRINTYVCKYTCLHCTTIWPLLYPILTVARRFVDPLTIIQH